MIWGVMLGLVLAAAPEAAAPSPQKTRIAVLDVQYAGTGDRKAVEGLSALIASEVARRPGLAVVSGADLRTLVGFERQRALVGCTEGACLTELAGTLGVAYLVSSEVSTVGSSWLLSLGLLDARRSSSVSRLTRRSTAIDGLVDEASRAVDELLASLGPVGAAPRATRYDGAWEVVIDCPSNSESTGAKGYSYRFPAVVKDGTLVGTHGAEGAPGSLKVEGTIPPDGKAQLVARGRTAGPEYSVKHIATGTAYSYSINARFDGSRGTGSRLEGRVCSFTFERK
jgi:hypothetical protein